MANRIRVTGTRQISQALRKVTSQELDAARVEVMRAALNIQRRAKQACPIRKGRLRQSISVEARNAGLSARIGTNVHYAAHVEFGTPPHEILPRRRRALRFKAPDGSVVFARRVRHPGTKPRPYLFPAAEAERRPFVAALERALARALTK